MNKHLEHYFLQKYPKIFRDMYGDPRKTCMAWGIACGDGWFHILNGLCHAAQGHIDHQAERIKNKWAEKGEKPIPQLVAHQIKEKFGTLRFYKEGGDDFIDGLIRMAEEMTACVCENCGSPKDVGVTKGWIQFLCPNCAAEYGKVTIPADKEIAKLWKKVLKSRKNPKRAWKGQDEPFTKEDLIPPYEKNKPKKKLKK